jgi:U32 family peptidase
MTIKSKKSPIELLTHNSISNVKKKKKKKKNAKIELLAPAGSFGSLIAAVEAGADAVYFGIKGFNMRDRGKNFTLSDLPKIKKICETKGLEGRKVKRYLTLNIIAYDKELKKIEEIIKRSKKYINAIICWDLGIIRLCKKYKVEFHISTQASISNIEAAKFYKKLGAKRLVLARELNLKQIKEISKIIDLEVFGHGAMCVSVSGRCFMSQFLFNQSANRGKCLQPCRRSYCVDDNQGNKLKLQNNYVMSAKDLCSLPFIEKLKKTGIKSLKIEGRNREPEYVEQVIKIYRKALDQKFGKKEIESGLEDLNKVYNKGFSSGFFLGLPTSDDFSNQEHSSSTQTKKYIGRIQHYFSKKKVAILEIFSGEIKIGDELIVLGKNIGVKRFNIKSMEIEHKEVKIAKKGQQVGIYLPEVRKNQEVYLVKKRG